MIKILNLIFFTTLITIFGITFFTRDNYRNVENINSELYQKPIQNEVTDKSTIEFDREGYHYEITPLFDYELNGLVVHRYDYSLLKFYKKDAVFPVDLCMMWGTNLQSEIHKNSDLKFSQDSRWCNWSYKTDISINNDEISNNHIVVDNDILQKKFKNINVGDQIKITGKLVNVKAIGSKDIGKYDREYFEWKSSTTRQDTGGGACETIYVENVEIIKKGNPISSILYKLSLYGLLLIISVNILSYLFVKRF